MSKQILHLDDEPAIRDILAAHLGHLGYHVTSVGSPDEALQAAAKTKPDLVISDLQLEDGDGLETIAELRKRFPGIPVIMLTGVLIDPRVAKQSVAREVDVYLQKTVPLAKIVEEVKRLIGG
jgi:two-component system OmpR family response regulator